MHDVCRPGEPLLDGRQNGHSKGEVSRLLYRTPELMPTCSGARGGVRRRPFGFMVRGDL